MALKYDIEADWVPLQTCNYRCAYCFSTLERLSQKLKIHATVEEWRAAFDAVGRTFMLHITGGEPTIYPDFVALCAALTEQHYISFNTNLVHRSVAEFARTIDPSRIAFINAGLHLEERELRSGFDAFRRNIDALLENGFPVLVSLVATPAALGRIEEAAQRLRPHGLAVIPKMFRGTDGGRIYPDSYTEAERRIIREYCTAARQAYAPIVERNGEWPTIDMLHDDQYEGPEPKFTGLSCDAGRRFVHIEADGNVKRCGKDKIGNILAGTFVPRRRAASCDTSYCYYFCQKYTIPGRSRLQRTIDTVSAAIDNKLLDIRTGSRA